MSQLKHLEQFSLECRRYVYSGFVLLRPVTGRHNSRHVLNQWEESPKTITSLLARISRAWCAAVTQLLWILIAWLTCVYFDWLEYLLWFLFYDTHLFPTSYTTGALYWLHNRIQAAQSNTIPVLSSLLARFFVSSTRSLYPCFWEISSRVSRTFVVTLLLNLPVLYFYCNH